MPEIEINRRQALRLLGVSTSVAAGAPLLSACGALTTGGTTGPSEANAVTGPFSWKRSAGKPLRVLLSKHPYTEALIADIAEFRRLTGIVIQYDVIPEANYFDKLTIELLGHQGTYDVFMTGAYQVWQFGPPGWLENLDPWIANPSATAAEFDWDDFFPSLRDSLKWDFTEGHALGRGGQWAIPWGWESNVICYLAEEFARYGLRPPQTFDELHDTALAFQRRARQDGVRGAYGLAVRGSRNWGTIHPGFMTQFARAGGKDFLSKGGKLVPSVNSPTSVAFHRDWLGLIRAAGPADWSSYSFPQCAIDLGARKAGMMYDATSASYPQNQRGASQAADTLAWSPGPKGPDGSLATNLWEWSLALNSASKRKTAGWLFVQWATGKQHLLKAVVHGNHVDPVRASITADPAYRTKMAANKGYLDTVEEVVAHTKVQFTPQKQFFDFATTWAAALQEIFLGADPQTQLDSLVSDFRGEVGG